MYSYGNHLACSGNLLFYNTITNKEYGKVIMLQTFYLDILHTEYFVCFVQQSKVLLIVCLNLVLNQMLIYIYFYFVFYQLHSLETLTYYIADYIFSFALHSGIYRQISKQRLQEIIQGSPIFPLSVFILTHQVNLFNR